MTKSQERYIKSRQRVRDQGEVFTPEHIVKQMCDLCEPDISDRTKIVLEPAAGNGNFLVEILARRLAKINKRQSEKVQDFQILQALSTIYAIDIMADNVVEAKNRLTGMVNDFTKNRRSRADFLIAVNTILNTNIINGDTLRKKMWQTVKFNNQELKDKEAALKLYEWQPDIENQTFNITEWTFVEIEKRAKSTRTATIAEIPIKLDELAHDGIHELKPTRQKSLKTKIQEELPLFNIESTKGVI
jgi:type I restriction-modification system DNA methylase subunit